MDGPVFLIPIFAVAFGIPFVIAVEVEKLAEGQRFVTKLLAERERVAGVLPSRDH